MVTLKKFQFSRVKKKKSVPANFLLSSPRVFVGWQTNGAQRHFDDRAMEKQKSSEFPQTLFMRVYISKLRLEQL